MTRPVRQPMGLKLYKAISRASAPVASFALKRRLKAGKEDAARVSERRGEPSLARPTGILVWIHGASVGESLSVVPLVEKILAARDDVHVLVTTGTTTSADLMAKWLPARAFHQYIPLDHPEFVRSFLLHWRPNTAIFVESEFWPNLILLTREHAGKMAIVNGRISPSSYEDWKRQPNSIRYLLSSFDTIIAQDSQNADRLSELSGIDVAMYGNLKSAAAPLPVDEVELEKLTTAIGDRPCWLAASTHPGEEEIILAAHDILRTDFPDLLTIIAPRHPKRGAEIEKLADAQSKHSLLRSVHDRPTNDVEIYIANTLGELGLFYRLTNISFVGGSLVEKGGHNPLEPARLKSSILHGPNTFNFEETYDSLRNAGGSALVRNERELASAAKRLLSDTKTRQTMAAAAKLAAEENSKTIVDNICGDVLALLPPVGASQSND